MRHPYWRAGYVHEYGNYFLIAILTIAAIALILFIIKSFKEKNEKKDLNESQKENLENFEGLVCSMISQNGEGLKQYEISSNIGLPLNIVSEKLNDMQKDGTIERKWNNDDYTYIVKKK